MPLPLGQLNTAVCRQAEILRRQTHELPSRRCRVVNWVKMSEIVIGPEVVEDGVSVTAPAVSRAQRQLKLDGISRNRHEIRMHPQVIVRTPGKDHRGRNLPHNRGLRSRDDLAAAARGRRLASLFGYNVCGYVLLHGRFLCIDNVSAQYDAQRGIRYARNKANLGQ